MRSLRHTLVALLCTLLIPAVAHGETLVSTTGSAITIVDNNTAGLGSLTVDGADGDISDLDVDVNLSHGDPFDVDLALVSPDGEAQILMSDACGSNDLTEVRVDVRPRLLRRAFPTPHAREALCGQRRRTSAPTENVDRSRGPGKLSSEADLDGYNGENPNGTWRLFVADDAGGAAGTVNSWSLRIETEDSEIVMPGDAAGGLSRPYPSAKSFDLEGRAITDLNLKIDGFHHPRPDDVDVVLQSPSGQAVMVFSDACGDGFRFHANWLFDDEANFGLNDNGGPDCSAVQQKPSVFGEVESLPPPAPPGPYATSLSAFDDLGGANNWRLYVNDDTTGVSGYVTFWEIVATTRPAAATGFASTAVATAEGQTAQLTVTRAAPATGPATLEVSVNPSDITPSDIGAVPTQLQFARGETSKTIEIPIPADLEGETAETFVVGLANALDDAALADATAFATVTIAPSAPDNRFTLGKPKKLPNGFARLPVTIPYAGTVTADDATAKDKLNQTEVDLERGGTASLTIKPAKNTKRKLRAGKKIKLTAEITYTPYGGTPNEEETKVTLKKRDGRENPTVRIVRLRGGVLQKVAGALALAASFSRSAAEATTGVGDAGLAALAPPDAPFYIEAAIDPDDDQEEAIDSITERFGGARRGRATGRGPRRAARDQRRRRDLRRRHRAMGRRPRRGVRSLVRAAAGWWSPDFGLMIEVDDADAARELHRAASPRRIPPPTRIVPTRTPIRVRDRVGLRRRDRRRRGAGLRFRGLVQGRRRCLTGRVARRQRRLRLARRGAS